MSVRTRFAPSPTGFLHVGGLRTALYAYLFAKQHDGKLVLRIEDTDQSRKVEGAMEKLIDSLHWAGIDFDEGPGKEKGHGPYIQSQRLALYRDHVEQLIEKGDAYYCFCTSERLAQLRTDGATMYDRHCRTIPVNEAKKRVQSSEQFVVRMKIPDNGEVNFKDEIRGDVSFSNSTLDDQVLLKSDGFPTYHLAVVVDDHAMEIDHVIRGEEWLPSTPKHILLYRYFGWDLPKYAHLPLLLNADKSKLSKRQGDVAVEEYRDKGYLKEALVNFVAFLGWNPGDDREIFSLQELINDFSLERVGKSGAVFNIEKLNWLNQQHLKLKPDAALLELVKPLFIAKGWDTFPDDYFLQVIRLMKERVVLVNDFVDMCEYFFIDPVAYDESAKLKSWKKETPDHILNLSGKLEMLQSFQADAIETALRSAAQENNIGAGKLIHPLRLAVSGVANGPSLFHFLEVLGKETTVRRIKMALEKLQ